MSRTDSANGGVAIVARAAVAVQEGEYAPGDGRDEAPADESERARLIADITRLIREPTIPEGPRSAGLTLIGWLARRRPEETPHGVGVTEARSSESRRQAGRAKPR